MRHNLGLQGKDDKQARQIILSPERRVQDSQLRDGRLCQDEALIVGPVRMILFADYYRLVRMYYQ
jgi:hypothetical protein